MILPPIINYIQILLNIELFYYKINMVNDMKKILIILITLFINIGSIYASERQIVTLNKCVDGDTAWFNLNNETIKTRFLAIDTPESTNKIEEYGKEASSYTCNLLTNASVIEIEYDENSDKTDKYKDI